MNRFCQTMVTAAVLIFGLPLCAQQDSTMRQKMLAPCSTQHGVRQQVPNICKSVLTGTQISLSNNTPRNNDGSNYITFDVPGAVNGFFPAAINASGAVVGWFNDASFVSHGFVRDASGNIATFDIPGGVDGTFPEAINPQGTIMGQYCEVNFVCLGFLRSADGTITTFDVPGDVYGIVAFALTPAGAVTGYYFDASAVAHGFLRQADGTTTTFDVPGISGTAPSSLNPAGVIAGGAGGHGFVRSADGTFLTFDPPGGSSTCSQLYIFAPCAMLNPQGAIASSYFQPIPGNPFGGNYRGMLRNTDGTIQTFDAATYLPCCIWTFSTGIAPDGTITGFDNDGYDIFHGFLRSSGGSITLFDVPGAGTGEFQGTVPVAISTNKVVLGYYIDGNGATHGFLRLGQ